MGKGGSQPTTTYAKTETSNLPEYAKPYYEKLMSNASGMTLGSDYQPYGDNRIADFTPGQQYSMNQQVNAQGPGEYNSASTLATAAGLGSLNAANYNPQQFSAQQIGLPNLQNYQMGAPQQVQAGNWQAPEMGAIQDVTTQQYQSPEMQAAQTNFGQNLQNYQMAAPDQFGQKQADQYMSPYQQSVIDIQKREATRDAKKGQLVEDLGAARQGTYGGSRQLLAGLERERNLGQQVGDIQQKGSQAAYENAQQQFERDRAAQYQTGAANQQASLSTQGQGLQAALANLDADSQSRVQNLQAQLQTQGMNADQALRAAMSNQQTALSRGQANLQQAGQTQGINADQYLRSQLANQQAGIDVGSKNLQANLDVQNLGTTAGLDALKSNQQYNLEAQRLGEQSRQFGAGQALQGYGQAGNQAQTLLNIGQGRFQTDQQLRDKQMQTYTLDQAMQQQGLDQRYQDYLRQQGYPLEMLQQYSSLLRGVPVTPSTTTQMQQPSPNLASQILGTGVGALGAYKSLSG